MRAKRVYVLPILLLYVIGLVSCKDWGEVDPPAGNQQIGEAKETVAEFTFETLDMFAMELGTYEGGAKPELVRDEKFQSNVLHLNGGYIGMDNPLIGKTIENGVSVSIWTKMSAGTITRNGGQEEQNETSEVPADSNGALLSFTNDSESFVIMQDGSVLFRNESIMTGVQGLSDGEWHYWTLSIGGGYISLYADGSKKAESELSADAYGSLSVFLTAGASNMYIGYGSTTRPSEMWVEDLKFVNGVISEDEVEVPATGIIVVGATDFSSGWWQAFSPVWTIEGNAKFSCEFKNYSSMKENWHNYILCVCNGVAPGKDGYKEYAIIRADNFGWIDGISDDEHRPVFNSSFNWDTFKQDMNESTVNMSFTRNGNKGEMKTVITTVDDVVYNYTATISNLPDDENIGVFLTVENAYLEILQKSINVGPIEDIKPENQIGNSDCTSPFYSETSDIIKMKPTSEAKIKFKNYTQGAGAYQNWCLVVNNGFASSTPDFKEYALLRADNWGWLDGDNTKTFVNNNCAPVNNYKVVDDTWSDFRQYMNGATVEMTVRRLKNKISMNAVIITKDNTEYNYYWKYTGLPENEEVGICLTIDNSYLVIEESSVVDRPAETVPQGQIGTSDFMTGWWEVLTSVQQLEGDGTVTYTFVNHSNRVAAWNNWALGVSNGMASGDNGYQEYAVVRADNYGFISTVGKVLDFTASYGDVILAHLLDGANVTLTIERKGVELIINAKYVKDGQTYTYGGTLDNVVPATGTIGTFLTVDASYLTNINCIVN